MAFKMKGSAFKLNNVATKSALKDQRGTHIKEDKKQHADADHTWESHGGPKTKRETEESKQDKLNKRRKAQDLKPLAKKEIDKSAVPMKSPLEQKLNENPHAQVQDRYRGKEKGRYDYGTDPRTGEELKGFRNDPWDPIKGVIRPNEEQWYEDNPNMSPTADEQDIFAGRDIQATRAQYRKNPDTGYRYTQAKTRGGSIDPSRFVSMEDDMGVSGINDKANVNRSIRLEKEKRKDEVLSRRRKGEMNWPK
tara:strand:+ start:1536 stop:2285 length:750 start_codon:yes stop_codon:yes gene_type:complete